MRFKWIYGDVGRNCDWAEQLGKSGEYRMGRLGRGLLSIQNFEGGNPRMCRLMPASVGSE
jgi:hypothetical protein